MGSGYPHCRARVEPELLLHLFVKGSGGVAVGRRQAYLQNHIQVAGLLAGQAPALEAQLAPLPGVGRNLQIDVSGRGRHLDVRMLDPESSRRSYID